MKNVLNGSLRGDAILLHAYRSPSCSCTISDRKSSWFFAANGFYKKQLPRGLSNFSVYFGMVIWGGRFNGVGFSLNGMVRFSHGLYPLMFQLIIRSFSNLLSFLLTALRMVSNLCNFLLTALRIGTFEATGS